MDFAEIARLVERRIGASLHGIASEVVPLADGWMVFDAPGSPVNKICGIGLDRPLTDEELDELVAFFTKRGAEPKVELSPFSSPALLEGLARRGFILREFENTLVRAIPADAKALLPGGWPDGVTVERVDPTNKSAVREQLVVSFSGFFPEGATLPDGLIEFGMRAAQMPECDMFVARVDGEAVGGGSCESRNGVTMLFGTSVKPGHRRRGIQQALIAARLARGRERGSHLAAITSRPGIPTERNAARLGFGMAYSRVVLVKPGAGLVPSP
jgi:hypothetical protein